MLSDGKWKLNANGVEKGSILEQVGHVVVINIIGIIIGKLRGTRKNEKANYMERNKRNFC